MEETAVPKVESLADRVQQLYDEHSEGLARYLLHIGQTSDQADDLVQEAFLRLFEALQKGTRIEKPKNWLLGVLHHIKTDELRRTLRTVELGTVHGESLKTVLSSQTSTPETEFLKKERTLRLEEAMQQLTERQYQYLILRTEGLKLREIADVFGVTVQSVAEVCTRAIDHLGRVLNE